MKKLELAIGLTMLCMLGGCFGYSSTDNNTIAQPKKLIKVNPILCPNYTLLDASLGIMRNGVGSMSTEDHEFVVTSDSQAVLINKAIDSGFILKINYQQARATFCTEDFFINSISIEKDSVKPIVSK